ncbi:putative translation initiation factor [Aspergillus heteromorphus CBS 117.55]|uniref:Methylthioribose-1-phosphate isomerase n=1 Tax=Aspergillus heteromorphus CBS 117.55 TaxID=1448321 RepID=A0A317UPT8_9EURO|nr:putative translation initiation factor [Aspergillus heteromorphus CBS 117.55]PWY63555.1 putative translation initiation factor [Aspergillus heteromorphus CBS 117.55]
MTLQAIRYSAGNLSIIDQLQLPYVENYIPIRTSDEAWHAIKEMRVRGAPAIAIVAALALASELQTLVAYDQISSSAEEVQAFIIEKLQYLVSSRPTAVNLGDASRKLSAVVVDHAGRPESNGHSVATALIQAAEEMLAKDINDNIQIGAYGAQWILANGLDAKKSKATVLTHCNTGSLATSGYGTALGVIRALASTSKLRHAYCTETRPYNQGSRLTAFELVHDNIPATLITDSMAAALLAKSEASVDAIVVGADRVAANGDTANKIGTYALAVLAKYHGVKFLVAAPLTTIDLSTKTGNDIIIEERPASEVTKIKGPRDKSSTNEVEFETVCIAASGINVWNPAFDITPSALIDGIITEKGVVEKDAKGRFQLEDLFCDPSITAASVPESA